MNPQIHPNKLNTANTISVESLFLSKKKLEIKGIPKKPADIMEMNDKAMKKPFAYS
jgi:hypothetical protein